MATRNSAAFCVSDADVAAVGTAYAVAKVVTLTKNVTRDERSIEPPTHGCYLDHIECDVTTLAGGATTLQVALYHDALCNQPFYESSAATVVAGLTTATTYHASFDVKLWWAALSKSGTAIYAVFKTNAGTLTVAKCRLVMLIDN